jgi:hypothetical protein
MSHLTKRRLNEIDNLTANKQRKTVVADLKRKWIALLENQQLSNKTSINEGIYAPLNISF